MVQTARSLATGRHAALVLVVSCAAATTARPVLAIGSAVARDPNEGWNALLAARVQRGEALYFPKDALVANNYPPLSFELLAHLGQVLDADLITLGRVVASLALLACAVAVFVIARRLGVSRLAAAFGAGFSIAQVGANHAGYVAMNDPQWLGHALQLSGFALLLGQAAAPGVVALAVFALLLGLAAKHSLIVLPLLAAAWVARERRNARRAAVLALGVGLVLGGAGAWLRYGGDLVSSLALARPYELAVALRSGGLQLLYLAPVALVWLLVRRAKAADAGRGDAYEMYLVAYFVLAAGVGILLLGGAGVDTNVMFDAVIAAALLSAVAYERAPSSSLRLALLSVILVATPLRVSSERASSSRAAQLSATVERARDVIAALPGEVACWDLDLCYRARKRLVFDAFSVRARQATGALPRDALARALRSGRFDGLQASRGALSAEEGLALDAHYERVESLGESFGDLFARRTALPSSLPRRTF